ncbi:methyl-accepting chemotaxis protein [Treponema brennaborense]|uniref:Methyl-accepting chemotaxis sensory transducer n=1 Tax=Treponema brennaborense (strain DSM 12168 / CIP 105900 / DD5/3) TaxID=906968 RepID=F4LNS7_TREBD|nr:methyl-accepting chemotaxis protein [Treponema brennaborense]AEE16912.1 methyl-accepting chemotaxis sensory transducer [Treponema brennaborense DSM 12168]
MSNQTGKKKSFLAQCERVCILPNILCGWVLLTYSLLIINIDIRIYWQFILFVVMMIFIAQFGLAPITNKMIMGRTSKLIDEFRIREFSVGERTELFLHLHKVPERNRISTLLYFFLSSNLLFCGYYFVLKSNLYISLCTLFSCYFGSYIACLLEFSYTKKICSKYEAELVGQGIDQKILDERKWFGEQYEKTFITFVIIPVVFSAINFILLYICYFFHNSVSDAGNGFIRAQVSLGITREQLPRLIAILAINIVVCIASVYSFLSRILDSTHHLQSAMNNIITNDVFTVTLTPTDYDNEISYNIALVNKVVVLFRSILDDIRGIGKTMAEPIEEISEISESTASTSLEQSTGVKEILATMEETDAQTRGIAEKIADVTAVAENTAQNVSAGFDTLQQNLDKMNEITDANISIIGGIKELGDKIGSVWDIVKIINDIADQTRIIAFNAELEASGAGESGRNFHIVANEVRRLASGITNSVNQIKERIAEIQHSSDTLIITSESGTEKIKEGLELSSLLKEKFNEIQKSSEVTVESAVQIKEIIYQQSAAFDQIVSTVRQISVGIENFSGATATENETAIKLKNAANRLENLHQLIVS